MDVLKETMMDTSPLIKFLPSKLYHASSKSNHESIMKNGLRSHPMFGELYFCSKKEQCLMFTGDNVNVYEVKTKYLKRGLFRYSLDHNKVAFPFDCITYYDDIPTSAISKVHEY